MSFVSVLLEVSELQKKHELNKLKNQREKLRSEKAHKEMLIETIDYKIKCLEGDNAKKGD